MKPIQQAKCQRAATLPRSVLYSTAKAYETFPFLAFDGYIVLFPEAPNLWMSFELEV